MHRHRGVPTYRGLVSEEVIDSPTGSVAKHINEYVETGGAKGHIWQGVPTLLLTTRGRKTGRLRRTALIYGRSGDSYVVVASIGGGPKHPKWYLNLVANPDVGLQVGPDLKSGTARTADQNERSRLWSDMARIWRRTTDTRKRPTARFRLWSSTRFEPPEQRLVGSYRSRPLGPLGRRAGGGSVESDRWPWRTVRSLPGCRKESP